MPRLEISRRGKRQPDHSIGGREAVIGRGKKADVRLDDERISRRHARVFVHESAWFVEDLKTANGTWVNGVREFHRKLKDGDKLELGEWMVVFRHPPGEPVPEAQPRFEKGGLRRLLEVDLFDEEGTEPGVAKSVSARALESHGDPSNTRIADPKQLAAQRRLLRIMNTPHLVFRTQDEDGPRLFPLERGTNVVGSSDACQVRLPELRRRAASLIRGENDAFTIRKLGVLGTMTINGKRTRRAVLHNGDVIAFGGVQLQFKQPK